MTLISIDGLLITLIKDKYGFDSDVQAMDFVMLNSVELVRAILDGKRKPFKGTIPPGPDFIWEGRPSYFDREVGWRCCRHECRDYGKPIKEHRGRHAGK